MDGFGIPNNARGLFDPNYLDSCLKLIRLNAGNPQWITERLDFVHKTLQGGFGKPRLIQDTIDIFLMIANTLVLVDNQSVGINRLLEALIRAIDASETELNSDLKGRLSGVLASFLALHGDLRRGVTTALLALDHIWDMRDPEAKLHALQCVMLALGYNAYTELPQAVIDDMLALVETVENPQLVAETHVLLAHYRNTRSEDALALEHARLAIDTANDPNIQLRAHMQRATAFRLRRDFARSEQCLQDAMSLNDLVENERRNALVFMQQAGLYLERLDYARAEKLYRSALKMCKELDLGTLIPFAKHGLALVLPYIGKFDEARELLHDVHDEYLWNRNFLGMAEIRFALATCEARAGKPKVARQFMLAADGLAQRLEESAARDYLIGAIANFRRRLDAGEYNSTRLTAN